MNLFNIFGKTNIYPFVLGISRGGCRIHDNHSTCHYDKFYKFLVNNSEYIGLVIYHQSGHHLIEKGFSRVQKIKTFDNDRYYGFIDRKFESIFLYMNKISKFTKSVWIGPFVESRIDFKNFNDVFNNFYIKNSTIRKFHELDKFIKNRYVEQPTMRKFIYWPLNEKLPIDRNFIRIGDCITYRDTDHFSRCGEDI